MEKKYKKLKELDEYYVQALLLAEVVRRILEVKANVRLKKKPKIQRKPIAEFMKRMRVSTLGKFNTIGQDLVPVKPMSGPSASIYYLDFKFK